MIRSCYVLIRSCYVLFRSCYVLIRLSIQRADAGQAECPAALENDRL